MIKGHSSFIGIEDGSWFVKEVVIGKGFLGEVKVRTNDLCWPLLSGGMPVSLAIAALAVDGASPSKHTH